MESDQQQLIDQVITRIRQERDFAGQIAHELGFPDSAKYTILRHLGAMTDDLSRQEEGEKWDRINAEHGYDRGSY